MASPREARRALARGDVDGALVLLWNAVEPLRLRGDRAGLRAVERMAAAVAQGGDPATAPEAERLREEVRGLLEEPELVGAGARVEAVPAAVGEVELGDATFGAGEPATAPPPPGAPPGGAPLPEPWAGGGEGGEEGEERPGRRLGPLLWAAFIALVIILNVIGGLRGD